ncbi:phospholipase D-like domain-containing protein [Nanoarchaeota archaeon]
MKLKSWLVLAFVAIIIVLNWNTVKELSGDYMGKGTEVIEVPEEVKTEHEVYFCPQDDCASHLVEWIELAEKKVHCSFYDVDIEEIRAVIVEKADSGLDVGVVVDSDNYEFWEGLGFAKEDNRSAIMHNKFCVLDDQVVWTGSFNPTHRGNEKNNNNVVVYQSKYLAENFEAEFDEMWNGKFGKGNGVKYPTIVVDNQLMENYFCPEDWCASKLMYAIQKAEKSIYFMTFSFTLNSVGNELIAKHREGVEVKGVFEKQLKSTYSEHSRLGEVGIPVRWDGNKYKLHHKVFIIDNKTVVTGSFNPSTNGDKRNDENVLIIHNPEVAAEFLEEFNAVWDLGVAVTE